MTTPRFDGAPHAVIDGGCAQGKLAPGPLIANAIPLEQAFAAIDQMSRLENAAISGINQF